MLRRIFKVRKVGQSLVVTIPLGFMDVKEGDRVMIVTERELGTEIVITKEENNGRKDMRNMQM
jgi:antitoxin component of MazEF toxin-antitoxin module